MYLHDAPGPTPGPIGSIELQDSLQVSIRADCMPHGLVFLNRCLSQFLPYLQHPQSWKDIMCGFQFLQLCLNHWYAVLGDTGNIKPVCHKKPHLQLGQTVRIIKSRKFPCLLLESLLVNPVILDYLICQIHIQTYTMVIDVLVQVPQFLLLPGDWVYLQLFADGCLGDYILPVVLNKQLPFIWGVFREVSATHSIGLGRLTGLTEVLYQAFTYLILLLILRKPQGFSHPSQCPWKAQGSRMYCRAPPLLRGHRPAQPGGKAGPFKVGIICRLDYIRTVQAFPEVWEIPFRVRQWIRQVNHLHALPVIPVSYQQYLEVRGGCICIHPCLPNINAGIGFYVHIHCHKSSS